MADQTTSEKRYEVVVTKDSLEDWTLFVTADSPEGACDAANEIVANCMFPEFEMIWSDYHFQAAPIHRQHGVDPIRPEGEEGSVCRICLQPARWTGFRADDPRNRSGVTIPGPWEHAVGDDRRAGLEAQC